MEIKENHSLKEYTTLKMGGPARFFVEARNIDEIKSAVLFAKGKSLPIFILGGGSNVLISDEGFNGLVILNNISGIEIEEFADGALVNVGAGEVWDDFVKYTVQRGLFGLECLSGIPGKVGAAPVQNIGAYGEEVSKSVKEVLAYDLKKDEVVTLKNSECGFSYRKSIFNSSGSGIYIILSVLFELKRTGSTNLVYKDLKEYFAGKPTPSLEEIRNAVIEIRARKGMVIHPEYETFKSAGSFFKNSIVSKEAFGNVQKNVGASETGWFWPQADGAVKISSAKLIELAGFPRGFKMGEAGISTKHSLSLINLGNASSSDLILLAQTIIKEVKNKFGVDIEPEVLTVGFKKNPLG